MRKVVNFAYFSQRYKFFLGFMILTDNFKRKISTRALILAFLLVITFGSCAAGQDAAGEKPLKVSILGDSYSTFEGWIPEGYIAWYKPVPKEGRNTDVTDVNQTWWKILLDRNGWELETNNSYSGSTVCNTGYEGNDYSDRSFINRLGLLGNPDVIFVFGGTNDSWAHAPVGEYVWENWTPSQLYTYRPAAAYMMSGLKRLYPEAQVICLINDAITDEVKESTAEVCRHYGIDYLQLEGIDKKADHPDIQGMQQIAEFIETHSNIGKKQD